MESNNNVLCNETINEDELAITTEEVSPGDIWEWNLMYGIGTDVY